MTDVGPVERITTGINGFDQVALGGLPQGRSTLVAGTTGTGKTLFAVEFLARGIQRFGEAGVFVTFEERPEDIRRNVASLKFPIARWESEGMWAFVDASADPAEEAPVIGAYGLGALQARISHAVSQVGATRAAIDSIGGIFARLGDATIIRRDLARIADALNATGVTSIVTAERASEYDGVSRHGVEEFVLDNVIILRNVIARERRRRTVEIVKMRGLPHRTGEWLFTIDPFDGLVVIPLAFLTTPHTRASLTRVSCGTPGLDQMCGGGFYKDAIILLTGPSGAGKTLASLKFIAAGVEAGERCLAFTFDETREQVRRNAAGWSIDIDDMEASGLLRMVCDYPETASLEDHFIRIRRAVEEFSPSRLVIDTVSALERIVSPRPLLDFIIALSAVFRRHEITTLLTSTPAGQFTPQLSPSIAGEITSLTDATITLRYFERGGEVVRAVTVMQTRGSGHDQHVRLVTIDADGMHIGEPISRATPVPPDFTSPPTPGRAGPATNRHRRILSAMNEEALAPGARAESSSPQGTGIGEDLNRLIVTASADGIVAVDDEGIIRLCNQAAAELLSRPTDQLVGSLFGFPLVSGRATEVGLVQPGGHDRVVEMRTATTTLDGKRAHIVALRDVTLRRQAERELAEALERQNVVLAVAAHELRSPLSALGVLASTLADRQRSMAPAERAELIDRIVRLTTRLQLLVRKLLTAARIEAGEIQAKPEPVPVLEVILEQLADISSSSEDVQVSCSPALTVVADRAALSVMLANYLDNALNYGDPPIEITASRQEGWAEIHVADHGPGVPASFAPYLFERFTRAPGAARKAEGTGLGLWIVRAFALANGGDAWYEPAQGDGSCFCFRLPLADAPRPARASG